MPVASRSLGLQLCEPRFSVYGSQAALIYLGMISLFNNSALLQCKRRILLDSLI